MTPERWNRISAIFDAVLEMGPQNRRDYLRDACAGDEALRAEVERMLAEDERTHRLLDRPVVEPLLAGKNYGDTGPSAQTTAAELTGKLIQGRFRITAKLGTGGMGEVYLADDPKLKRRVALKRLPPRMRSDERYRSNLLREARRASSLTDPHIAQVYDVLEADGEGYLVMEYIEGATLRQKIASPLPPVELLEVAIQCSEGLLTAHQKGIVHCDIKPENIMLTPSGLVKILDFGIAKRLPSQDAGTTTATVEPQGLIGTPNYMAPEVLAGDSPDARSDIYSLGVTLFEAGEGKHPRQSRAAKSVNGGKAVRDGTALPPAIACILTKMVDAEPAKRYPDAAELLRDLRLVRDSRLWEVGPRQIRGGLMGRRAALAVSAVLLVALLAWVAITYVQPRVYRALHPVPEQKQVAVLPFSVAGADAGTKAFADGLCEVVSAKLTQLTERPQFQVIPASEVRARHVATAADARKEFGVNLVIEGTWQQAGGAVHVVPVLIDAATNRQLRANEFVAASSDPIGLEAQVAAGVLNMLEIELQPAERPSFADQGTRAPDAYAYYLRGQGYLEGFQKPENIANAISVFGRALEQDPRFGLAYAGLGEAYWRKYEHTADSQWVARARESCKKASELGNAGAAGSDCLGLIDIGTGKYQEASEQYQKALALEPTSDAAYVGLGAAYEGLGRMDDAEKTFQKAIRLRPQCVTCYNNLGWFYFRRARYADSTRLFAQVVKISPDAYIGYSNLGAVYVDLGSYGEAVPLLTRSIAIRATYQAYSNLGTAYFFQGRFAEAVDSYERALKLDDRHYDVWGNLGDAYYWTPGRRQDSAAAYRRAIMLATNQYAVNPHDAVLMGYIAEYHAMLGERELALDGIKRALRIDPDSADLALTSAIVDDQFGDVGSTLSMLKRAVAAGISVETIRATPNFANLESEPGYQSLVQAR